MQSKSYVARPSITICDRDDMKVVIYSWWNIIRIRCLKFENGNFKTQNQMDYNLVHKDSTFIASSCMFETDLLRNANRLMTLTFDFNKSDQPVPKLQLALMNALEGNDVKLSDFKDYSELDMLPDKLEPSGQMCFRLASPWEELHDSK